MGVLDIFLFPVFLMLFYVFFKTRRNRLKDPVLKYYHRHGFWIKALMVIPFAYFNSRLSPGDSFVLYQREGVNIFHLILHDISNVRWLLAPGTEYDQSGLLSDTWNAGYCRDENNFMICRIVAVSSFFTLGRYVVTCLLFSMLSFSGVWRLYRFFYELFPHLHKELAIAILYLPTFVFWSSGILKDSLCTGAIGWITYAIYETLYKKKNILSNLVILIIAGWILVVLKIYILVSYVPFLLLFIVLKNVNLVKSPILKAIFFLGMMIGIMLGFTKIISQVEKTMVKYTGEGLTKSIQGYQKNYAAQDSWAQSNFSLGVEFDGSVTSLLKMAPAAVAATLFRPFIWESTKLSTLLSSFESMAIMYFTLRVIWLVGLFNFFKSLKDPAILFCFAFSILFALFVGATTPNFGTLCRYKIPCVPFFVIFIFLVLDKYGKLKKPVDSILIT